MSTNASSADVPAFIGFVDTTVQALRLIHAARQGVIPRITRRLNDSERRTMIKSGAVFVFSVEESGIKRWTDGLLWSPSRIVGNFLVYREINERSSSRTGHKKPYHSPEAPSRGIGGQSESTSGYKSSPANDQGTFKPGGLIKKTITVTVEGSDLHLISYYTSEDVRLGRLTKPTLRRDIMALPMPPHIFRLTNFRTPPKVEMGPDGKARLVCEGEDNDASDVKVEDNRVGHSPPWSPTQSSPIEPSYPPNNHSLYNITHHSSSDYAGRGSSDRWGSTTIDPRRLPGTGTTTWGLSNHHVTHDSRRESSISTDSSWSPLSPTGNRWEGNGYESNSTGTTGGGLYLDRSRMRTNTYPNLITSSRGSDDHHRSYGTYASGGSSGLGRSSHHTSYSSSHPSSTPRVSPSWMPSAEPASRDSSRTPHSTTAYDTASSSHHFTPHGYHATTPHSYGSSSWPSAESVSLDLPSSQSPFSQHGIHSYDQYGSGSGTLPSPEEFTTKVEEL